MGGRVIRGGGATWGRQTPELSVSAVGGWQLHCPSLLGSAGWRGKGSQIHRAKGGNRCCLQNNIFESCLGLRLRGLVGNVCQESLWGLHLSDPACESQWQASRRFLS